MAPSYDCAASILLCSEDNNSILDFDNEEEEQDIHCNRNSDFGKRCVLFGDFLVDFPLQSDDCLALLVERETEHLPREGYDKRLFDGSLKLSIRRDAIDWIFKVHAYYNFGPLSVYLAVNYLDRFLSTYELPQGKAWMTQLLSVACLSLAAKMEETSVPLSLDLQVCEAKYVFESKTIQRMELLVLSTLKWRMQAVTPFSFIDYFLNKFNNGNSPSKLTVSQAAELILLLARGTDFLAFRPSEIAAAVALTVLGETQIVDVEKSTGCAHVQKERVLSCHARIQSMFLARNLHYKTVSPSVSSVPQSPIGVLEAACLSCRSDETITVGSHANCYDSSPASKKRKIFR